ncbi:MAG TPA: NAD(P)H-quinone oxidoreductase [Streptosporangiaceae bacterium]|nr:NAD(P)H-quinone oxidoreductase [Streptosporangiaceae bacterium]
MRAVVITSPGGPEVLQLSDVPDPVPGEREVLVQVVAAGVNPADLLQRQGVYPPPPGASPYPGLECSGRIVGLGSGVTGWREGDEVCALLAGGGYAGLVSVPQRQLLLVPPGVNLVNGAALPEAVCTVYSTVFAMARLKPGETLLVHGGSGGVGSMAIQLAKAIGARVVCTAGTQEKLQRCRGLGADLAVSYTDDDFVTAVQDFTSGRGADVVLDIMGASYFEKNMAALATGGRLVVISTRGGTQAGLDLGLLMRKRAAIFASTLRARPLGEKARIVVDVRDQVWPLLATGQVVPVVDRCLPMTQVADAHRLMAEGTHIGKILLLNEGVC